MNRIEAEMAVLGCLMTNNRAFESIPNLEPHHFIQPEHVCIYRSMYHMLVKSRPVDPITVMSELQALMYADALLKLEQETSTEAQQ